MSVLDKYLYMVPGDDDLWGVVVAGGCYEYDNIIGIGTDSKSALIDAAKNCDAFRHKSQNPYDYQILKQIGMTHDAGDFYLTTFDPLDILTAKMHNLQLEDAVRWSYNSDDELGQFICNINDAVYQLNMMNGLVPFTQYGSYFWIYAEDVNDADLEAKVNHAFREFNRDNDGKRYSLYIESVTGPDVESIIRTLDTEYDMGDTALSKITADKIPAEFVRYTEDAKIKLLIPCEVMSSAKRGSTVNELFAYWKEFTIADVSQLVFVLDDLFEV